VFESNNDDDFFNFIDIEQDMPSFLKINFSDTGAGKWSGRIVGRGRGG
jgi:hypothetical protein